MRLLSIFFTVSLAFLCFGCSSHEKKIGPFKASYFRESTGELVASETVEWPALNYPFNQFHGIDAQDLYAIWEGPIELGGRKEGLTASFNVSWSDVIFSLDGKIVSKWSNSNTRVPLLLEPEKHSIKIEYHNNWHTVGFNTSFVSYPVLNQEQGKVFISDKIHASSKIICISGYKSGDRYNRVMITVPKTSQPIFLFFSSYDSINWVLDNPYGSEIGGVFVSSYGGASTVNNISAAVPLYAVGMSYQAVAGEVHNITGFSPSYAFDKYSLIEVKVPEI